MKRRRLAPLVAVGAVLLLALGAAGVVVASSHLRSGKGSTIDRVKTVWTNEHSNVTDGTLNLPGARIRMVVTKPSTLIVARFNASTSCTGGTGRCHADVVVLDNQNGDAEIAQMGPVGHMDSARPSDDAIEAHGIEQSITVGPGDYDFQVRLQTFEGDPGASTTFGIAQWHFTVERIVP